MPPHSLHATALFALLALAHTLPSGPDQPGPACAGATHLEHFSGHCMLHYECIQRQGVSIGPCLVSHILATCCMMPTLSGFEIQSKRISASKVHNALSPNPVTKANPITSTANPISWSLSFASGTEEDDKVKHSPDDSHYYEVISANNRQSTTLAPPHTTNTPSHTPPSTMPADSSTSSTTTPRPSPHVIESNDIPVEPPTLPPTASSASGTKPAEPERPKCGIRPLRPTGRVVGGRNAHFGEWPWQVLIKESTWLGFFLKTKCGGVLVEARWVLTAAHCQPGMMGSLVVMLGQHELNGYSQQLRPQVKGVRRMIVHRDYNPDTFENDIALLELDTPLEAQPHISPICLPEQDEDYVSQYAYVTGWGKLSYGGLMPSILQTVRVPIIANTVCQKMFADAGHYKSIRDSFLCAGYPQGGKDTCEGDSGGPLMTSRRGVWTLIATVSHGIKCAEPNMPGVYMKTFAYLSWIRGIIGHV